MQQSDFSTDSVTKKGETGVSVGKQEGIGFLLSLQRKGMWNEHESCFVDRLLFNLWC